LDAIAKKWWQKGNGKVKKNQSRKPKSGEYGSADRIPSPFIHLCDIWDASCTMLGVCTPCARYPNTDRGARARESDCMSKTNPVRQKTKCSMGAARRPHQSRRFGNLHSNCASTNNAHSATTGLQSGEPSLQCFFYQWARSGTMCQWGVDTCPLAEPHCCCIGQGHTLEQLHGEERCWPHL
jgi:hypothetical protein